MSRRKWGILLALYGVLMLWLLFGQRISQEGEGILQLRPFHTLQHFWQVLRNSGSGGLRLHAVVNLVGNVAMFVPLGFLFPKIWECWRKFWRHGLLMIGIIVAVELTQYFLRLGTCDVDDLILNLVGTTLGFLLWKWIP